MHALNTQHRLPLEAFDLQSDVGGRRHGSRNLATSTNCRRHLAIQDSENRRLAPSHRVVEDIHSLEILKELRGYVHLCEREGLSKMESSVRKVQDLVVLETK